MSWLRFIVLATSTYEWTVQAGEFSERRSYYAASREYCDEVGKPLLRIGLRRSGLEPPNGDVTLDLDPLVTTIPGGVQGDERAMPFEDKEFGVCFNEHTMEHMKTAEDVEKAVAECRRVADFAVLLAPSPWSLIGMLHPTHHLRLWFNTETNEIVVKPNSWRLPVSVPEPGYAQAMVLYEEMPLPAILT